MCNFSSTNIKALSIIVGAILALNFFSCKDREREELSRLVYEWQNKEIYFPDSMVFTRFGTDTISNFFPSEAPYKVLIYVDSLGCTSCKLQLDRWKKFITYVDSVSGNRIPFYFVLQTNREKKLARILRNSEFDYPVYIDRENLVEKLNKFPPKIMFQTFLLDRDNQVKVIGSPVYNLGIRDLYLEYLLGKRKVQAGVVTELKPQLWEYDLGIICNGTVKEQQVVVQNMGIHPFILEGITTSCDCTKAFCDWHKLQPGESKYISIQYTAEQVGDFFRTIEIYGNLKKPLELTIVGTVK